MSKEKASLDAGPGRLFAEERGGMADALAERDQTIAGLRARLACVEDEARGLRDALSRADERLENIRRSEALISEELHASYDELRVISEELATANAALEARVRERTAALNEAFGVLRSREEQLRLAQRCADAGAWDWDVAADQVTWTQECFGLLGLAPRPDPLTLDDLTGVLLPEDRPRLRRLLEAALVGDDDDFRIEFRIHHPTRGLRWIANFGRVVLRSPTGRALRISGLALDLTDRKAMEDSLRSAKETAEAASRAKTQFLSAASHDLRQPIQAAALYAYVLRRSIGTNAAAQENLDLLEASIDSLNSMLSGLLDLSRLEAGAVDVAVADFVPADLMHRLAAEFRGPANTTGGRFRCVPSTVPVTTDPHLLERVLRNLLSNAMAHGSRAEAGQVLLGCRRRRNGMEFQVVDNGPGIPEDARDLIFEEFRQLKNPERNAAQGFGLGLSIVARIARLLGLTVSVRSREGFGSVFSVTVPFARAAVAVHPRVPASEERLIEWLKGHTVLLVEDDAAVRRAVTLTLKRWGLRVVAVGSVAELTERLPRLRRKPHVLVTDYRLPAGATGKRVVELVRDRWVIPCIIITGDTAPEHLREARSLNCLLLHKPIGPEDLARTLGEAIAPTMTPA